MRDKYSKASNSLTMTVITRVIVRRVFGAQRKVLFPFEWGRAVGIREGFTEEVTSEFDLDE